MTGLRKIRRRLKKLESSVYAHVGRKGPYRFLIDPLKKITDIDLAARVVDVEFFRGSLLPVSLPVDRLKSVLVLAPHQDDETIGAGGTMVLASRSGARVVVLYLTDGMQKNLECSPIESVNIRHAEALKACSVAGAEVKTLGITNIRPSPTPEHLDSLADVIKEVKPDSILLPWFLDAPAKHRMSNHLLLLASRRHRLDDCEVWGYQVHSGIIPNGYVDITSVMAEKNKMLEAFESQNTHSQCYDHLSAGLSAWNSRYLPSEIGNVKKRYAELFFAIPLREHLDLTERFYLRDLEQTYRGNAAVTKSMRRLEALVN